MEKLARGEGLSQQDVADLRQSGALWEEPEKNKCIALSSMIINALPKRWGGDEISQEVQVQLTTKSARHKALLESLEGHNLLLVCKASVLCQLLENGEKLSALGPILEEYQAEQKQHGGQSPVVDVIDKAGARLQAQASSSFMEGADLYFASPGQSVSLFFELSQKAVQQNASKQRSTSDWLNYLIILARTGLLSLEAARDQHEIQLHYGTATLQQAESLPLSWRYGQTIRDALHCYASELIRIIPKLSNLDDVKASSQLLLQISYVLLDAFAAAYGTQPSSQLAQGYAAVKQQLLAAALKQAIRLDAEGDLNGSAMVSSIQSLAEAHLSYPQLFEISEFRGDPEMLYTYMLDLSPDDIGPGGDMMTYVFARLFSTGRSGELLSLPDVFNAPLKRWLQNQNQSQNVLEASYLHALRMKDFNYSAEIMRRARPGCANVKAATRLACLSKLASQATQSHAADAEDNGAISLLRVQATLGLGEAQPRSADLLLDKATEQGAQPDLVLNIIAAGGHTIRKNNKALWAEILASSLSASEREAMLEDIALCRQDQNQHAQVVDAVLPCVLATKQAQSSGASPIIVGGGSPMENLELLSAVLTSN